MRSTLEIEIAASDNAPATEQELRYALVARRVMYSMVTRSLRALAELVLVPAGVDRASPRFKARCADELLDTLFKSQKMPVDKYLGADGIPGSPERKKAIATGKAIFRAATGVDLDAPSDA